MRGEGRGGRGMVHIEPSLGHGLDLLLAWVFLKLLQESRGLFLFEQSHHHQRAVVQMVRKNKLQVRGV